MASYSARLQSAVLLAGRYALFRELAHGGMGSVWCADDRATGRAVAIKFQNLILDDRSFEREVAALRCISHEHVVQILDAGREGPQTFIVMELLRGSTLALRLRDGARLPLEEARLLLTQAARGLAAAHRADVVHRDIKPSNLFLAKTERGSRVKVLDFGIARRTTLDLEASASALLGSPAYMSPEQARGLVVDERTDLWSLAVVAFKMLTGAEPFNAGELPATLQQICEGRARSLRELRPDLPVGLNDFFERAFRIDPSERFPDALTLSEAFGGACERREVRSFGRTEHTQPLEPTASKLAPATPPVRKRRRWRLSSSCWPLAWPCRPAPRPAQQRRCSSRRGTR